MIVDSVTQPNDDMSWLSNGERNIRTNKTDIRVHRWIVKILLSYYTTAHPCVTNFWGSTALSKFELKVCLGLGFQASLLQDRLLLPLDSRRPLNNLARTPELALANLLEMDLIGSLISPGALVQVKGNLQRRGRQQSVAYGAQPMIWLGAGLDRHPQHRRLGSHGR